MKANRLVFTLLLLSAAVVFRLPAQPIATNQRPIAAIEAKAGTGEGEKRARAGIPIV